MNQKIIISLGGSLIYPDKIDWEFIKEFKDLVVDFIKKDFLFVIVCGGGKLAREFQLASSNISNISNEKKDLLGIEATKLNAQLIKSIFNESVVHNEVVSNPQLSLATDKKIIICSGYKPGCSTDYVAVLLAENLKANTIINMSNVTHIYDSDPKINPDAKRLLKISWKDYLNIIGDKWLPGLNTPFDPIASKKSFELGLKVIIIGKSLNNLKNFLDKKSFEGTVVSND